MNRWIVSIFVCFAWLMTHAQQSDTKVNVSFRVGVSKIDPAFEDNARNLSQLIAYIKQTQSDTTLRITRISLCSSASPEGSYKLNRRLAERRLNSLESYIRERVTLPDSIFERSETVIGWEQLTELLEASDMDRKQEVIDIINNVPEFTYNERGVLVDSRNKRLMDFNYGRTWNYMKKHFFPQMRNASGVIVRVQLAKPEPPKPEPEPEPVPPMVVPDTVSADTVTPQPVDTVAVQPRRPFLMALYSNMLYDVLAVPNIGAEFYLGKNWSVGANWMYGWWKTDKRHRYWRVYGGDIHARRWFGKQAEQKALTGHHLGVYGQIFTYDFEWGGKGYMGGEPGGSLWDKMNYAVGLEYGYSLPIARRFNIDFSIGVGYHWGTFHEYVPIDGHYVWQATKNRHWFGPTKLEISIVWLLGDVDRFTKKGGEK